MPDNEMMPPAASQMAISKHSHAYVWFLGLLTMALLVFIVGAGIWLYQRRAEVLGNADDARARVAELEADLAEAQATITDSETVEFREIAVYPASDVNGYRGVAELEGYIKTAERSTGLGGLEDNPEGVPMISCALFVVTDGPEDAVAYVEKWFSGEFALGADDMPLPSPWWNTPDIYLSTEANPVKAVFRLGTTAEGDVLVGCNNPLMEFIGTTPN